MLVIVLEKYISYWYWTLLLYYAYHLNDQVKVWSSIVVIVTDDTINKHIHMYVTVTCIASCKTEEYKYNLNN